MNKIGINPATRQAFIVPEVGQSTEAGTAPIGVTPWLPLLGQALQRLRLQESTDVSLWSFRNFIFFLVCVFVSFSLLADSIQERTSSQVFSIRELVQRGLENSRELKLMDQDIERAKKELKFAKTSYFPHLTLQGSLGVDLLSPASFDANRNLGSDLVLDWNFFQNGLVFFRVAQAKAQVELAILQRKHQEIELSFQFENRICELLDKKALITLQIHELDLENKSLEKTQSEFQQGKTRRMDVLKVRTKMFEKQNTLERMKREYDFLFKKLKEDMNLPLNEDLQISWDISLTPFSKTKEMCTELALANRTEVKEGEIQCNLSEKALKVAKLGRFPRLDLFAGNAFALDDFERSTDQFQFRTGVIARYPLYDGGETKLQITLAELAKRKAYFQWDQTKQKIEDEVEKAYSQVLDAQVLLDLGKSQLQDIQTELEQSEIEYKNGNLSDFEWQEATLTSERARVSDDSLKLNVLKAWVSLAKALGFKSLEEAFIEK